MADVRYTRDHEWIRLDGEIGVVGITTYAQSQLGDVVFVELPAIGKRLEQGAEAAVVESVKAASEVYSPVGGEVVAVNDALEAAPAIVNEDAEGKGWFLKLKLSDPEQFAGLMSAEEYQRYVETIG
jgi:glycine cleavage system H protein